MGSVSLTLLTVTCRKWSYLILQVCDSLSYIQTHTHTPRPIYNVVQYVQTITHFSNNVKTVQTKNCKIKRSHTRTCCISLLLPRSFIVFSVRYSPTSSLTSQIPHFHIHPFSLSSSPRLLLLLPPPSSPSTPPLFCCSSAKHGALPLPRLIDHQFSSNLDQVSW